MIEASLIFVRWLTARIKAGRPVYVSIRDAFILYVAFSCLIGMFICGLIFFGIEKHAGAEKPFVDCLFHVASAMSSTGLITLDTSLLQTGSNIIIFLSMAFFANTLLVTQVPVVLRIWRVKAAKAALLSARSKLDATCASIHNEFNISYDAVNAKSTHNDDDVSLFVTKLVGDANTDFTQRLKQRPGRAALKHTFSAPNTATSTTTTTTAAEDVVQQQSNSGQNSIGRSGGGGVAFSRTIGSIGRVTSASRLAAAIADAKAQDFSDAAAAALGNCRANLARYTEHKTAVDEFLKGPDYLGYHWCFGLGIGYYFLIVFSGFVAFSSWGLVSESGAEILKRNGVTNLPWFAAYHSLALFTNTGMMLISDNMIQFRHDVFFVITSGVIALLGFSYYPAGFRVFVMCTHYLISFILSKLSSSSSSSSPLPSSSSSSTSSSSSSLITFLSLSKIALRDILDHPRKYTTHLYSPNGTLALVLMSFSTQAALLLVYLIFDFPNVHFKQMFEDGGHNFMNGWFSSAMVYNAGFNTFDLSLMNQGSICFLIMCMWLTGRPFFLGILVTAADEGVGADHHGMAQKATPGAWKRVWGDFCEMLRTDGWVMSICTIIICLADSDNIINHINGPTPSMGTQSYIGIVPVVFDLASAYGNVGLSLGYPNTVTASCAVLSDFSKLVIIFMCAHGYCMGIFPASLSLLELPIGVDVGLTVSSLTSSSSSSTSSSSDEELTNALNEAASLERSYALIKQLPLPELLEFNIRAASATQSAFGDENIHRLGTDGINEKEVELEALLDTFSAPAAATLSRLAAYNLWRRVADSTDKPTALVRPSARLARGET